MWWWDSRALISRDPLNPCRKGTPIDAESLSKGKTASGRTERATPGSRSLQRHHPDIRLGDPPREVRCPVAREARRADHIRGDGQDLSSLLRTAVEDVERLPVRDEEDAPAVRKPHGPLAEVRQPLVGARPYRVHGEPATRHVDLAGEALAVRRPRVDEKAALHRIHRRKHVETLLLPRKVRVEHDDSAVGGPLRERAGGRDTFPFG